MSSGFSVRQTTESVPLLDLKRQYEDLKVLLVDVLAGVNDSGMFVLGPEVQKLEHEIASYLNTQYGIGCASGSDALLLSLMAAKIGPGDEVIVPSFTFFATASCVARLGATPVFADIDPVTYNLDPKDVEAKITPRTRAIIPVHLYGQCADMDTLNESSLDGKKVSEIVLEAIAEIGEKVSIRRFARYASEGGRVTSYIHMGGKIGVLVELTGGSAELGKDIAMQIAAANPSCVDRSGLDPAALEHEREVLTKQAMEENNALPEGKRRPEAIIAKMVDGRLQKNFYKEACLVEQPFVKDPEQTVAKVLGSVAVKQFTRFQLGEGIENKQEDFAAEVAAQIK